MLGRHSSAAPCSSRPAASVTLQHHQHALQQRPLSSHIVHRQAPRCRASSTGNSNSSSFSEQAQRFAGEAQQKMQDFVKQQELDRKAAEASKEAQKRMKSWGDEAEQNMRRTYMKLESEHNLSQRFGRTRTWVSEKVRDIDQEWSVRRRVKTAVEDVQRKLPLWKRQFSEFSSTPLGKAALTLGFVSLLFSGFLWQLVNAFWLLFWLSIPVSALIASQRSKEAAQQEQQQQQQRQQQQSPFSSWMGNSGSSSKSSSSSSEGPIVEAEWVSLDENDEPKGGWKRR